MKTNYIQYFVEGNDEKKIIDTLKTQMRCIKSGKVQILNVTLKELTPLHLRALKSGTMVVLVFDTDVGNINILQKNLQRLKKCNSVSEIITIPQSPNLEVELVRSCDINKISELLNSKSEKDFKRDLLRVTNLDSKLIEHKFNIDLFWNTNAPHPYQDIANQASRIKLK